jgi:hypothetical protein
MAFRSAAVCLAAVLLSAGCGGNGSADNGATLASGEQLPARCTPGEVGRASTVTFVARGQAWALNPHSGRAVCLFRAPRPGPFEWGPRADRALLAHLQVKPIGDAPRRAPSVPDPATVSWGRPTGKSIVFVSRDGRRLLKAHPGTRQLEDVTPLRDAEYKLVTYHPSGLAFAFVIARDGHESLWISTNTGEDPEQLVHGRLHTGFDAIAFGDAGQTLYFAARHRGGVVHVHALPLVGADSAPVLWAEKRGRYVSAVFPGWAGFAITAAGSSCASTRAVIVTTKRAGATPLPNRPSRAIGWLDDKHLLVEAGGCGEPLDLYSVQHETLAAQLLVKNVEAASVRRPEPLPPPPLPIRGERGSFA